MAPAERVPLLRFEAPAVFELWSAAQREAEVAAWCQAHLEAVLTSLAPDCCYCFGEDFARARAICQCLWYWPSPRI